jgi:sec-independent protein translocase protein TatB
VFDLSLPKLLILAVIALVVFGPNELPKFAAQAGRALRDLRRIAEGAKTDLRESLGSEFPDFDLDDLNPRRFVHKHLLSDADVDHLDNTDTSSKTPAATMLAGEKAPYDAEAT